MENIDFGFKIKKLREQNNISQEDFSDILQISQSCLSKIENGKVKKIDYILIHRVLNFFSISIDDIIKSTLFFSAIA